MLAPRSRLASTSLVVGFGGILYQAIPTLAIEPIGYIKETAGVSSALGQGCSLDDALTGDCANLRYYNLCAGYLWVYASGPISVGVRFDGPCVSGGGAIERAITYWRNVYPGYGRTVEVSLDADEDNDGCPDSGLAEAVTIDPALRWNCSTFGSPCLPQGLQAVILRSDVPGSTPSIATDGPFTSSCDPDGRDNSYYYGASGEICKPWRAISPTGRGDNFLYWLIVDSGCEPTATQSTTWGNVKGLFE